MKLADNVWILQLVRHCHCAHEAWNCFMIQNHDAAGPVGGDHDATQMVGRNARASRRWRRGTLSRVAPGEKNDSKNGGKNESANHTPVYNRARLRLQASATLPRVLSMVSSSWLYWCFGRWQRVQDPPGISYALFQHSSRIKM